MTDSFLLSVYKVEEQHIPVKDKTSLKRLIDEFLKKDYTKLVIEKIE